MECPYCLLEESDQRIVLSDELVRFAQDPRYQGALTHSGIIIPVAHRETVFDLTDPELAATFRMLRRVKAWMDAEFSPDGYNVGWNCGRAGWVFGSRPLQVSPLRRSAAAVAST